MLMTTMLLNIAAIMAKHLPINPDELSCDPLDPNKNSGLIIRIVPLNESKIQETSLIVYLSPNIKHPIIPMKNLIQLK